MSQARPGIELRSANEADASRLMEWRNQTDAVRFSVTGGELSLKEHERWLASQLANPTTRLWIAEHDHVPVGQVRITTIGGVGTVSIAIAADQRRRGVGTATLRAMIAAVREDPAIHTLKALVHPENTASLHAFERVGFRATPAHELGFVVLERSVGD